MFASLFQAIIAQSEAYKDAVFPEEKIREKLPVFKSPDEKVNVWAVIKDCIGKDLTKFSVPGKFIFLRKKSIEKKKNYN